MSFSTIQECCGTMNGLQASGGSFTHIGLVTHDTNLHHNQQLMMTARFIKCLQSLFPPPPCRDIPCGLDLVVCRLSENDPMLRLYSYDLDVPIYFSTNHTGSLLGEKQDWFMEAMIREGRSTPVATNQRCVSDIYFDREKLSLFTFSFGGLSTWLLAIFRLFNFVFKLTFEVTSEKPTQAS
jgi:hypothetical protein